MAIESRKLLSLMGALCHTSVSTINLLGNTIEESIIKR
jgi:hypothetical protein